MSSRQISQVFKDKPISRATIFRVLKNYRDGKKQENKEKIWSSNKIGGKNNEKFAIMCQK